eukprot:1147314-Pelagomonas_calceolata.AAC.9
MGHALEMLGWPRHLPRKGEHWQGMAQQEIKQKQKHCKTEEARALRDAMNTVNTHNQCKKLRALQGAKSTANTKGTSTKYKSAASCPERWRHAQAPQGAKSTANIKGKA